MSETHIKNSDEDAFREEDVTYEDVVLSDVEKDTYAKNNSPGGSPSYTNGGLSYGDGDGLLDYGDDDDAVKTPEYKHSTDVNEGDNSYLGENTNSDREEANNTEKDASDSKDLVNDHVDSQSSKRSRSDALGGIDDEFGNIPSYKKARDSTASSVANGEHDDQNNQDSNGVPKYSHQLSAAAQVPAPSCASVYPSIFGNNALNELTETVANFLANNLKVAMSKRQPGSTIEIEGKLGIITDKSTAQRVKFPVYSATALVHQDFMGFSSDMNVKQHQFFNELLNGAVGKGMLKYRRRHEIDRMISSRSGPGGKVRVTHSENGEFLVAIRKTRIGDMEIMLPNSSLDIRISVNIEEPIDRPPQFSTGIGGGIEVKRDKNRMTYESAPLRIDLTQVRQFRGEQQFEKQSHELEIEFMNGEQLWEEFEKLQRGKDSTYHHQIEHFLNTIRYLSRKSPISGQFL